MERVLPLRSRRSRREGRRQRGSRTPPEDVAMNELIGKELGQYQLKEVIRRGGMATVYKAYQPALDRFVAVKVLHNRDPQFAARFKREARAIAQLQHHNILPIYDYGEQDGLLYLVLQYIENGTTLSDLLGTPMDPAPALRLIRHVLDALEYAHQRGIIHRDIKPANILMPSPVWPMLADFGIAKLLNDDQRLTMPGLIIGTAAYMAPEQADGRAIDARTDLYALGVVLYEMLTGRVPFDADTPMAVLTKHAYEPPPPPRSLNPNLPAAVESALLRALAKNPADRYQSAAEMAADLERVAAQLERSRTHTQLTGFYQTGVRAFEEGRWDEAVEHLSRLVEIDPLYEDAADLLEAARAAQERAREEARRQLEQVRLRHSTQQQQLPRPGTAPPAGTRETHRLPPLDHGAPTSSVAAAQAQPAHGAPAPTGADAATPLPAPAARRGGSWLLPFAIVVALVLASAGLIAWLRPGAAPTGGPTPTAGAGSAATSAPRTTPAATLQPTSAPAPTQAAGPAGVPAPAGTVAYEDDFNSGAGKSGLEDRIQATDFQRGFHDPGYYHIRVLQPNETHWVLLPRFAYGDFSVQIDLWDNSDDFAGSVAQGLIFRVRDNTHFYALLIDPRNGTYTVRKQDGANSWSDLIPAKPSPLIKQRAEINKLRIDAQGETFTIYLNGAPLDSFSDNAYPFGMLGLIVANIDAQQPHMHFDNLTIWSSDPPPPDPGVPPTREDPAGAMVLIPGGEFIMGGNEKSDELAHIVSLPNFYIDRTEVTNSAYRQCVAAGACTDPQSPDSRTHPGYYTQPQYDTFPVIHVTWQQAQAFCTWAGKHLPTEAEWEKAASWNSTTRQKAVWPWGNEFDPQRLNSDEAGIGDTSTAGQYPPEINGTVDMGGNVSEWTSSLYTAYPYDPSDGREDPQAPGDRVYRGGSWAQTEGKARTTYRLGAPPTYSGREIGFRCADTP
jgi:serine/threonine protein kinase/formylglycine-generating enzyme required for sulfatase activity